jgi:hypothetical protein
MGHKVEVIQLCRQKCGYGLKTAVDEINARSAKGGGLEVPDGDYAPSRARFIRCTNAAGSGNCAPAVISACSSNSSARS